MNATVAVQMVGADFLKLRKRVSTVAFGLALACLPIVIFYAVNAAQHSSDPANHGPAGGVHGFTDALRLLVVFMGPLAAVLIGADAGTSDNSAGVFRDLVVTGRSRVALFASRVPAALALCLAVIATGWVLAVAGAFLFASGLPTPDASLLLNSLGWALLANGVLCVVAVGVASLVGSRPAAITALVGWQLVASPLIASASSLGSARDALLSQSLVHFSPVALGDRGMRVSMSLGLAVVVAAAWLALWLGLGAWRTRRMDA